MKNMRRLSNLVSDTNLGYFDEATGFYFHVVTVTATVAIQTTKDAPTIERAITEAIHTEVERHCNLTSYAEALGIDVVVR